VPLLEVKDLAISFLSKGKVINAVEGISFSTEKGETLGILGESGSGKTVTALSLLGLLPKRQSVVSGQILFHTDNTSVDLLSLEEDKLRPYRGNNISMIFQEPMTSLNPVITCGKQVMEVIRLHRRLTKNIAKERTIDWFAEVQLPRPEEIFCSYPHQLSGGQRQRVMIAMAMACMPSLLIADEPTTALDVTVQKTILDLMVHLREKYRTGIIFISHDIGVISQIADRICIMKKGKIVEEGQSGTILNHPHDPYTKGLLACRPPLNSRPKRLLTVQDYLADPKSDEDHMEDVTAEDYSSQKRINRLQDLYVQKPLLVINNLSKRYDSSKSLHGNKRQFIYAVDNVSFEVYKGETVGLIGESGCGKTTLGRTILRLVESSGGDVIYNGVKISTLNRKETRHLRNKMQIIFQDPYSSLNPRITAGEAISEPLWLNSTCTDKITIKKKTCELLTKTGLDGSYYNRYPHELSGGQRQRVVIARALATSPEFIICDESVSALDVSVQAQVLNLLNSLKEEFSLTYIFISHDLAVIKYMCDRIIVMKDGKIIETGESDHLYDNPSSDYTKSLIESVPVII